MFYEIQPGKHINLKDISYLSVDPESDIYRNSIRIYFRGKEHSHVFQFNDSWTYQQAYDKLIAKMYSINNPSHIKTIMD